MKIFKLGILALSVLAAASFTPMARAIPIASFTSTVGTGGTQQGRLVRNNIQQDWTGSESFPGVNNPGVTFNYKTFAFNPSSVFGGATYIDISVYDELNVGTFFLSAYANSYDPSNLATNWLGDEGASGNFTFFASGAVQSDARYFDIILPVGDSLILVANNTAAGGVGNNVPFDISINAYTDTNYTDPAPLPEPSSFVLLGTGLVGVAAAARRRIAARA